MTSFHKREYEVQFWVGPSDVPAPWSTAHWPELRESFSALVSAGRQPIRIHSSQIDLATRRHVRFGKLAWSPQSDSRWMLESPDQRHFETLEMWAPSPTVCKRESRAPDTYFDLTNMNGAGGHAWFAVAALACEIPASTRRSVLAGIHASFSASDRHIVSAVGSRWWGYSWGDGFEDGMQELSYAVNWQLARAGGRLSLETLRGQWVAVEPAA